jgi:acetyl-CoA carboxylase biotin carboxylase subunit
MVAKLIVWGRDRQEAIARMNTALREYEIKGIETTIPFHLHVMKHPDFKSGNFSTNFVDKNFELFISEINDSEEKEIAGSQAD